VIGQDTYDAFGRVLSQSGTVDTVYLFAGEPFDPGVGAYYLRARYYNMAMGRFLSTDPLAGSPEDPSSLQKYLYADADPVNKQDPTGQQAENLVEVIAGLAVAADPSSNGEDKSGVEGVEIPQDTASIIKDDLDFVYKATYHLREDLDNFKPAVGTKSRPKTSDVDRVFWYNFLIDAINDLEAGLPVYILKDHTLNDSYAQHSSGTVDVYLRPLKGPHPYYAGEIAYGLWLYVWDITEYEATYRSPAYGNSYSNDLVDYLAYLAYRYYGNVPD
jgi:RHS repeat-associated protein